MNKNTKNKKQTGAGWFSSESYLVSIKSKEMKHSVELVCEICKKNVWKVQKAMISKGRVAAYFDAEWAFDKTVRTCTCTTCSNMKWFKEKDFIKKIKK